MKNPLAAAAAAPAATAAERRAHVRQVCDLGALSRPLDQADVILLLESATPWHPPSKGPGAGCKVISIGQDPDRALRPYSGYPCDIQICGSAATNLQALTQIVRDLQGPHKSAPYAERTARLHDNHRRLRDTGREEALTDSQATSPACPPDEGRKARTEKRSVSIVKIDAPAR